MKKAHANSLFHVTEYIFQDTECMFQDTVYIFQVLEQRIIVYVNDFSYARNNKIINGLHK